MSIAVKVDVSITDRGRVRPTPPPDGNTLLTLAEAADEPERDDGAPAAVVGRVEAGERAPQADPHAFSEVLATGDRMLLAEN